MAEKQTTEKQSTFKELVLPVIVLVVVKPREKKYFTFSAPPDTLKLW